MNYKQILEQIEYVVIARLDLLSDKRDNDISEFDRLVRISELELLLSKIQKLESQVHLRLAR